MPKKSNVEKATKPAVPSVEKALDIIELLSGYEEGLTVNEMTEALGRSMGEIYRIVVYLAERGYLEQNIDTSRYALTLKLFELSHRHNPTERLITRAHPILERITAQTEQSCHLGVLNRDSVLVLLSVQSPRAAGYSVRTGALFSIEQTSSGFVILAFSPQDAQMRQLKRLPEVQRDAHHARIERIRARGYEDTPSTMVRGVRNLCVPVFDSQGVTAAITTGFISQFDQTATADEALSVLQTAARELSRSLGSRRADWSPRSERTERLSEKSGI